MTEFSNPFILIIDVQNVYRIGEPWACETIDTAIGNIEELLKAVPKKDVLFTKYLAPSEPAGVWKAYNEKYAAINADPWMNEIVDELKPYLPGRKVIEKSTYSSYLSPEVQKELKGRSAAVLTGVVAECCVLSTLMSLIDAGIYAIYLTDAVSGLDKKLEEETVDILKGLAPLHLRFMTTEEYFRAYVTAKKK